MIQDKLNEIIDQRRGTGRFEGRGRLQSITHQKERCADILKRLNQYQSFYDSVISELNSSDSIYTMLSQENPELSDSIYQAQAKNAIEDCQNVLRECSDLEKRFGRDELRIGVIGQAGTGKSTLLQSISGLPSLIIPTSDKDHCTGAKSLIVNADIEDVVAEVDCMSEVELLELIGKYLVYLGSTLRINSMTDLLNCSFSQVEASIPNHNAASADMNAKLEHLRKYVEHAADYAQHIGQRYEEKDEKQIRKFVAQQNEQDERTYDYLAVKEVRINTKYPYADAGKIVLVDTVGMGDTALGIEESMIKTLREDCDAAIRLRRTDGVRSGSMSQEEIDLSDIINKHTEGRMPEKWFFMFQNYIKSSTTSAANIESTSEHLRRMSEKGNMKVALIDYCDCSDKKEVEERMLIPVLQTLTQNLKEIDEMLITTLNEKLGILHESIATLLERISAIRKVRFSNNESFGSLFDELYKNLELPRALRVLQRELSTSVGEISEPLNTAIKGVAKKYRSFMPTVDDINYQLESGTKAGHGGDVHSFYANKTRTAVLAGYEEVCGDCLIVMQDEVKRKILEIIFDENLGRLSLLPCVSQLEHSSVEDQAEALIHYTVDKYPLFGAALQYVLDYVISIQGLIDYMVNENISLLDPDHKKFIGINFEGVSESEKPNEIYQYIFDALEKAHRGLHQDITRLELLLIPNNSHYTRLRNFIEKIIFDEAGESEKRNFYRDHMEWLWPNECGNIADKDKIAAQWKEQQQLLEMNSSQDNFKVAFEI